MRKIIISSVFFLLAVTSAGAQNEIDFEMSKNAEIFMNLFRDVNLFYVDSTDPGKMIRDAADGMLKNLDPYTEYVPESEKEALEFIATGAYGGIGSTIRKNGEWIEIQEPYRGSPADKAGLKAGDRILEINSESIRSYEVRKISNMLKGSPGTKMTLTVRPVSDTTTVKALELKREKIIVPSVPYSGMLTESIGYIMLNNFTEESTSETLAALKKLRKNADLSGLVLDLRSNGGGLVSEAAKIMSLFVPRGTKVVEIKGKVKEYDANYKTTGSPIEPDLPVTVLINSASASAAEIVAGAMQDLDRGVVIGQRSFGKGLVQVPRPVGYNSYLKVTTAKYYIPSGRCIQAMDYTHRREDGSVGQVPDSLISEFRTSGGRKVYDGGGINPDIKLEPEYMSKFAVILLSLGHIDNFANRYAADNLPVENFEITDQIYGRFENYMDDKAFTFESATAKALKELKDVAEKEKYSDRITEELAVISEKIKDDKAAELKQFAPEIKDLLTQAIINRWFYGAGQIEHTLKSDTEVAEAVRILSDAPLYNEITTKRDIQKD